MENMPMNVVILGSIPEATLVLLMGLALLGIRGNWKKVLIIGIIQGVLSYFTRRYLLFGMHTVTLYLTMTLLTWLIIKTNILVAAIASALGMIINSLIEGVLLSIIINFTAITLPEILSRDWLRIAVTTPKQIVLLILVYLCLKYSFTLDEDIHIFKRIKERA
ncbi:hypothetical protein [Alkaliphilus serpentinus]|uniref:Uncharacterized protein n=1 Tax=Alkaliphilus serpentinus TaxID=1482731 RepID=A0A833HQN3_9FIRM|nr:hypothetical protein [Alkaliphilus serpentinus]KAB3532062.1 hypothetical protein F8153_03055 [Alkaliphilus serpentinus]